MLCAVRCLLRQFDRSTEAQHATAKSDGAEGEVAPTGEYPLDHVGEPAHAEQDTTRRNCGRYRGGRPWPNAPTGRTNRWHHRVVSEVACRAPKCAASSSHRVRPEFVSTISSDSPVTRIDATSKATAMVRVRRSPRSGCGARAGTARDEGVEQPRPPRVRWALRAPRRCPQRDREMRRTRTAPHSLRLRAAEKRRAALPSTTTRRTRRTSDPTTNIHDARNVPIPGRPISVSAGRISDCFSARWS